MMRVIDLGRMLACGDRSLGGLRRGEDARAHFGLDQVDAYDDLIVVEVPATVTSVTAEFVKGFFGPSVASLGAAFRTHYLIDASGRGKASFDAAIQALAAA